MNDAKLRYCEHLRRFSDQLIHLQAPIKILDAIKWPRELEQQFFDAGARQLPQVDKAFYDNLPLPFDSLATQKIGRAHV